MLKKVGSRLAVRMSGSTGGRSTDVYKGVNSTAVSTRRSSTGSTGRSTPERSTPVSSGGRKSTRNFEELVELEEEEDIIFVAETMKDNVDEKEKVNEKLVEKEKEKK